MKKQIATTVLSALVLALMAIPAMAVTYTVTEFKPLGTNSTAYPKDVTNDGIMVGVSSATSGDKAVLWDDPALEPIVLAGSSSLPAGSTNAMAIGSSGTIVGNQLYYDPGTKYAPVVWNQLADGSYGEAELLPVPADLKNGHTEEINSSDVIVGSAAVLNQIGQVVGLVWQRNGTGWDVAELARLSGQSICNANDINDSGVITGTCGATAVKWIPSGGSYGAPVALSGASASAVAINDGDVVVGALGGNPAKWVGSQSPTLPFGKKFGGNSSDVNNDGWIVAKKSSGSVLFYHDGTSSINLSNIMAAQISGFGSAGFGGDLTNSEGGITLISASANVLRNGANRMVPVLITVNSN